MDGLSTLQTRRTHRSFTSRKPGKISRTNARPVVVWAAHHRRPMLYHGFFWWWPAKLDLANVFFRTCRAVVRNFFFDIDWFRGWFLPYEDKPAPKPAPEPKVKPKPPEDKPAVTTVVPDLPVQREPIPASLPIPIPLPLSQTQNTSLNEEEAMAVFEDVDLNSDVSSVDIGSFELIDRSLTNTPQFSVSSAISLASHISGTSDWAIVERSNTAPPKLRDS